ncbi:MAG: DNA-formamidopyrimidine glycosylase, partial [Actinobacteria bacterium]|nr:DNA-formamidopyrimidine glycosylase [Actinomycetota bacterium]
MPELPEVETIRRDLDKEIAGKKIKSVEVTGARSTRRHEDVKTFIDP